MIPSRISSETPSAPLGDITSLYRPTTEPRDTLGRRYSPKTFPNSSARHPWATLQAYIVPQQFCAAPSGNTMPLFRRWRVRIEAVLNKPGDSFSTLGRRFKPTSFHNRAMRHSRATLQPLNVPQQFCATPLGNITASKCSPTEPRDTLGRRYSPKTFPNSSARHPWATLQAHIVPQQSRATPSGNTSPLFRRRNVRIDPVMNMLGDTFSALGRHYKPISFHNRAARHSRATYSPKVFPNSSARHPRATLKPRNVPQQFCAAPSGNALPLFRRWRVRIEAVFNKPGDSFSTLGRPLKPISFHNRDMRHSRAALQPLNVPQQFCATPSGNTLPLFRRRNIRIDPVMNKPGDTFGTAYTLGRHYKPISSHNRAARHPRATLRHFFAAETYALIPS